MKLQIFCGLHGVRIENIKKIFVLGLGFGDADLGYIKHLIYETQGISEDPESYLEQEEKAYLDSLDSNGIMHINMQYAFSRNPNPSCRGRGFVARLSGSTIEFISMWKEMYSYGWKQLV